MKSSLFVKGLVVMFVSFIFGCSSVGSPPTKTPPPRLVSLPENPCDVLTVEQVSVVTGLRVVDHGRVPSLEKVVKAREQGSDPPPGRICSYETSGDFGAITLALPLESERSSIRYWEVRNAFLRNYPGSGQSVGGVGAHAWIGGGNTLHVLVEDNVHFTISTQMYHPAARDVLTRLATTALNRF